MIFSKRRGGGDKGGEVGVEVGRRMRKKACERNFPLSLNLVATRCP